ncbi:MAG: hypothetical protein CSB33_04020 [Desulfobacterales bacterium]|nr:MAG: hypothetical protein CSB33_04020 [Desulfobacterales bacterium]
MPANLPIARILNAEEQPEGTGVLVGPLRVLTCHHVVEELIKSPRDPVNVAFPFSGDAAPRTARIGPFRPVAKTPDYKSPKDLCLLKIDPYDAVPPGLSPCRFSTGTEDLTGLAVRIGGFPDVEIEWAEGRIVGPITSGFWQMDHCLTSRAVTFGYSGAPVWRQDGMEVVGIAVGITKRDEKTAAYLIPADLIRAAFPSLFSSQDSSEPEDAPRDDLLPSPCVLSDDVPLPEPEAADPAERLPGEMIGSIQKAPLMTKPREKIFISYAHEDVEMARRIYTDLKAKGFQVWMDKMDLIPGQAWPREIRRNIKNSRCFLALLSSVSLSKTGFVQRELKTALEVYEEVPPDEIFLLPARLDQCCPNNEVLKEIHWADFTSSYEEGFAGLVRALEFIMPDRFSSLPSERDSSDAVQIKPAAKIKEAAALSPGQIKDGPLPGMKFAWIPPGSFRMGSPDNEPGRWGDEGPQHKVKISKGFWMQTTAVTQAQWEAVMGSNPSHFKNGGLDCPVERVSWNDAQELIKKLNQQGRDIRFRLPTEAEWEYACRAGTTTAFYNGEITNLIGVDPNLDRIGWYDENSNRTTHPVGQKEPNAWGLYDMIGNVWEWCQDLYGDYPDGAVVDPEGVGTGSYRVVRGGGWDYGARDCRSADRYYYSPSIRNHNDGFRLVLPIGQQVRQAGPGRRGASAP